MSTGNFFTRNKNKRPQPNGFAGVSEVVIAAGVGTLLIMASGAALRSTGTLLKQAKISQHFGRTH